MVEKVKHILLQRIGKIEIRRYPSLILAKVDGYGDAGFNILFRYISGFNLNCSFLLMKNNFENKISGLQFKLDDVARVRVRLWWEK